MMVSDATYFVDCLINVGWSRSIMMVTMNMICRRYRTAVDNIPFPIIPWLVNSYCHNGSDHYQLIETINLWNCWTIIDVQFLDLTGWLLRIIPNQLESNLTNKSPAFLVMAVSSPHLAQPRGVPKAEGAMDGFVRQPRIATSRSRVVGCALVQARADPKRKLMVVIFESALIVIKKL